MKIFEALEAAKNGKWIRNVSKWGVKDYAVSRTDTHDKINGASQMIMCCLHRPHENDTSYNFVCRPLRIDEINLTDEWEIVGERRD